MWPRGLAISCRLTCGCPFAPDQFHGTSPALPSSIKHPDFCYRDTRIYNLTQGPASGPLYAMHRPFTHDISPSSFRTQWFPYGSSSISREAFFQRLQYKRDIRSKINDYRPNHYVGAQSLAVTTNLYQMAEIFSPRLFAPSRHVPDLMLAGPENCHGMTAREALASNCIESIGCIHVSLNRQCILRTSPWSYGLCKVHMDTSPGCFLPR